MTRKEAIKPDDIEITYSRSPNLIDVLIQGNLNQTSSPKGTTPCGKTRCKTCNHIQLGSKVNQGQDTHKRKFYMPIQEYSLFTYMQYM